MDLGRGTGYRAQASKFTGTEGDMFIQHGKRRLLLRLAVRDAVQLALIHPDATTRVLNTKTHVVVWP